MKTLIFLLAISCGTILAQEQVASVVTGKVTGGPAVRSVFIFEGVYKDITYEDVPVRVIKTDKFGNFKVNVKPCIYTFAIAVNGRYVAPVRNDGFCYFQDCLYQKECKVNLVDDSKQQE